jgi:MFS family permease
MIETQKKITPSFPKYKGISSLIGAILQRILMASFLPFGSLYVYLVSYLHETDTNLTLQYGYFLFSFFSVLNVVTSSIGGFLEHRIGLKQTIFIGNLLVLIGFISLYFSNNIFLDYGLFGLFGIGIGISFSLPTKNICLYYYDKKGLFLGLLALVTSITGFIVNYISEKIINPDSTETVGDFYPKSVSEKIFNYILFQMILSFVVLICSLFLIYPFEYKIQKKDLPDILITNESKNNSSNSSMNVELTNTTSPNDNIENNNNNNNENEDDNIEKIINEINEENNEYISYSHVKIALKSIRLWRLFFIGLTISPLSSIIRVTYRPIGIKKNIVTQKLQFIGYSGFLVNCFFSPLFGYLSDKIQYKHVYCVITFLSGVLGISYFYSFSIPNLYVFLTLFNSVIFISTKSFNPIHVMKTFGMKHYVEINGIINISSGIIEPLSSVFAFFIEKQFTDDNRDKGYKIIFISTGVLCFIGMILSFFEDEKKEYEK